MVGQVELECLSRTAGQAIIESLRTNIILQISLQGRAVEKSTDRLSPKRTTWKGGLNAAFFLEEVTRNNASLY